MQLTTNWRIRSTCSAARPQRVQLSSQPKRHTCNNLALGFNSQVWLNQVTMALQGLRIKGVALSALPPRPCPVPHATMHSWVQHRTEHVQTAPCHRQCQHSNQHSSRLLHMCRATEAADAAEPSSSTEYYEVELVKGIRANYDNEEPIVEYWVQWKDGAPDSWELATNLSPDLIRDFDERWWNAARKGDEAELKAMLACGKEILSQVVDDGRRSALHFAAALNSVTCIKLLAEAGADLNLQEREGYTPLHMAAGYMQVAAIQALLELGADPQITDRQGRNVVTLVDNLRAGMPVNAAMVQRRLALENAANALTGRLYEEVEPLAILDVRRVNVQKKEEQKEGEQQEEEKEGEEEEQGEREFLVQFKDDRPDEWIAERDIAADLVEDWDAQLEQAPAELLLDMLQQGTERSFLVKWADGRQDSWEPEEHVPVALVEELQERRPELFKGGKGKRKRRKGKAAAAPQAASNGASEAAGPSGNGEKAAVAEAGAGSSHVTAAGVDRTPVAAGHSVMNGSSSEAARQQERQPVIGSR